MRKFIALSAISLLSLAAPTMAFAHIDLISAGTHVPVYNPGPDGSGNYTKTPPCGDNEEAEPTGAVYTYKPGEVVTIKVNNNIPHPGYFRIAFDHGEQNFVDPLWIVPMALDEREYGCPYNSEDQCRPGDYLKDGDFYNNPNVLQDNILPTAGWLDPEIYTFEVKMPDMECDDCNLQIIQVMMDPAGGAHGPFNSTNGDNNDIYHQCIAIRLTPDAVPGEAANDAALAIVSEEEARQAEGINLRKFVRVEENGVGKFVSADHPADHLEP